MLVSTAVKKIRNLLGYYAKGSVLNDSSVEVNDNMIIESINNTLHDMSVEQYRPFLKTFCLNGEDMLGTDLFRFGNSYKFSSIIPNTSTTPVSQYLEFEARDEETRVNFFYDEKHRNGSNLGMFHWYQYTYYPNEYDLYMGQVQTRRTTKISPLQSITLDLKDMLNTYKSEFVFKNSSNKVIDRWTVYLNSEPSVTYKSKTGVFLYLNFEDNFVTYDYKTNGQDLTIEYRSHISTYTSSFMLLYNGELRINGGLRGIYRDMQIQAYVIPYSVKDLNQQMPEEVTGELHELFSYKAALDVQKNQRSIDTAFANVVSSKEKEYKNLLQLKRASDTNYFPALYL